MYKLRRNQAVKTQKILIFVVSLVPENMANCTTAEEASCNGGLCYTNENNLPVCLCPRGMIPSANNQACEQEDREFLPIKFHKSTSNFVFCFQLASELSTTRVEFK